MRRFVAAALVSLGVAWSGAALADDEGSACEITADCGEGLRCIEGTCVSIASGKLVAPVIVRHERSAGDRAWIGDGKGYAVDVVVGDVVATAASGALVAIALGTGQGWFAFAALFPTTLTAPIIHAANGRGGPAAISFFAWAALPPTLTFFAGLTALATAGDSGSTLIAVMGFSVGVVAAAGLTALDAYFARIVGPARPRDSAFSILPTVAPARGGITAGVAGIF